jgi:RNA polymerase sigma-70 factor (ECF subfamily)
MIQSEAPYRAGNVEDFARLYQTSYRKIFLTIKSIIGDADAAEDCTQDAFLQAFRKWATWEPIAPAEAWVMFIAKNNAISWFRKQRIRTVDEVVKRLGPPKIGIDPQDCVDASDIGAAIASLPPKQSEALILRYYHGHSNRDISRALGIPERTVASRLSVAREHIRTQLGPTYAEAMAP